MAAPVFSDSCGALIAVLALVLAVVPFLGLAFWQVYWLDEVVWWGLLAPAVPLVLTGFALAVALRPDMGFLDLKRVLRRTAFLLAVFCCALFLLNPVATALFIPAAVTLWFAAARD